MGRPLLAALLAATAVAYTHVQSELMALIEKDIDDIYAAERARAVDGSGGLERRAAGRPSIVNWDEMMKCLAIAECRAYVCERADPFMYQYMLRDAGARRTVGAAAWVDPIHVYGAYDDPVAANAPQTPVFKQGQGHDRGGLPRPAVLQVARRPRD